MEQQLIPLPGPRISRVTIARLHNLGNFEHIRYEVTVELPPGTSPSSVFKELDALLTDVEPKRPVSNYELREALKTVSGPEPTLADIKAVMNGAYEEDPFDSVTPEQALQRKLAERERARRALKRHDEWMAGREAAMARLDALGGAAVYTDARDGLED